jgi:septal ring-binding cell division protein DamX
VQLLTVKAEDARRMENFLQRTEKVLKLKYLWVYSVKIDGNQYYRVAYGQYPTSSDAKAAIEDLPQILKSQNPYPRSIERMRSQNRQ